MPFPTNIIKNWTQHSVEGSVCTRCGLAGIPASVVQVGGIVYEKEGRFMVSSAPGKLEVCQ